MKINGKVIKAIKTKKYDMQTISKYTLIVLDFDSKETICCVGDTFELFSQCNVVLEGNFGKNAEGKQMFFFNNIKIDYVTSNDFFRKIFGDETKTVLDTLDKDTVILQLKNENEMFFINKFGFTEEQITDFFHNFRRIYKLYELNNRFSQYGLTVKDIQKIAKRNNQNFNLDDFERKIKQNPFKLIKEFNFDFNKCDIINAKLGHKYMSSARIYAGLCEALREEYENGNTYVEREFILNRSYKILNIKDSSMYQDKQLITLKQLNDSLDILVKSNVIVNDDDKYYLSYVFEMEEYLRNFFSSEVMETHEPLVNRKEAKDFIAKYENEKGFSLGFEQKEAIINSLANKISIITGGAGTGKTSSLACIIAYFLEHGYTEEDIALCSPTGKASQRMRESIGKQLNRNFLAQTIHLLLGARGTDIEDFTFNEKNKLPHKIVVVDESSMIDLTVAYALLRAVKDTTKIVFLGDIDQLPPVKAGYFLRDMLHSGVATAKLTEIHRQKGDSSIIPLSLHIKSNDLNSDDFKIKEDYYFVQQRENFEENLNWLVNKYMTFFKKDYESYTKNFSKEDLANDKKVRYAKEKILDELMIVTPLRETKKGAKDKTMNAQIISNEIQNHLFPDYESVYLDKNGYHFILGSKVIVSKNNNEKGLINGQIGYIRAINLEEKEIIIYSEEKYFTLDEEDIQNLMLAYAITVHRSQGSEWKTVIYCCFKDTTMNQRNLVYTAVTRAKKRLLIFGDKKTFLDSPVNLGSEKRSRIFN